MKRQVAEVEIEGRIGHLGAELLSQVGDGVAGLLLKLANGIAEPHPLGLDRHLARPGVRFLRGFLERGAHPIEPFLPLLAGDTRRVGKQRQDPGAQLDQPGLGLVAGLGLGIIEPLDELQDPVAKRRVGGLGLSQRRHPGGAGQQSQHGQQQSLEESPDQARLVMARHPGLKDKCHSGRFQLIE